MIKMKKSLVCILLCLVLALSFAACKNDKDENDGGGNGSVSDAVEGTTSSYDDIISALEGLDSANSSSDTVTATEPETMPKGDVIKDNNAASGIKKTRFYTFFNNLNTKDNMTFSATCSSNIQGATGSIPIKVAQSGKKSYMSIKTPLQNGVYMTFNTIYNGKDCYVVFPELKMYMAMSSEDLGDVNGALGSISSITSSMDYESMEYISTSKIKSGNTTYICEEYKQNSSTIKFYFTGKNDDLVKMEIISEDGIMVFDNIHVSGTVEQSLFELPSGYTDMSKLYASGGTLPGISR